MHVISRDVLVNGVEQGQFIGKFHAALRLAKPLADRNWKQP